MSAQPVQKTIILLVSIGGAMAYGIIHDQITAHLCVEYFTVVHPPIFHTQSPTVLAFCWGIAATVGIGAVFGSVLAEVSQSEGLPPYPILRLCRLIFVLLATTALAAFLAGLLGFELSRYSLISPPVAFAQLISPARHNRFMAVWFAHGASYLAGLTGGTFLILHIWNQRGRPRVLALFPRTKPAIIRALFLAALVALILFIRFARS